MIILRNIWLGICLWYILGYATWKLLFLVGKVARKSPNQADSADFFVFVIVVWPLLLLSLSLALVAGFIRAIVVFFREEW